MPQSQELQPYLPGRGYEPPSYLSSPQHPDEHRPKRPVLCCLAPLAAAPSNPKELASFGGIQVSRGSPPSACRPVEQKMTNPPTARATPAKTHQTVSINPEVQVP